MMNKGKYFSIFMIASMIAIPVGAIMTLIVYEFGVVAIPKGTTTYDFIKDHGSLLGGLLGAMVAVIVILISISGQKRINQQERHIKNENELFFYLDMVPALLDNYSVWMRNNCGSVVGSSMNELALSMVMKYGEQTTEISSKIKILLLRNDFGVNNDIHKAVLGPMITIMSDIRGYERLKTNDMNAKYVEVYNKINDIRDHLKKYF